MSFVPVSGPARLPSGDLPRDGTVEFTDERRTIVPADPRRPAGADPGARPGRRPPERGAAQRRRAAGHAAGRCRAVRAGPRRHVTGRWPVSTRPTRTASPSWPAPGPTTASTRPPPRASCGRSSTRSPTRCPAPPLADPPELASTAVGRAPHRVDPTSPAASSSGSPGPVPRARRPAPAGDDLASASRPTRRSWSPARVRLVLQVHAVDNAAHVADAATAVDGADEPGSSHGFGDRARTHASIALRAAADAWPVLDRLLDAAGPRRDHPRLRRAAVSLLDEGASALGRCRPSGAVARYLDRDVTHGSSWSSQARRHPRGAAAGRALRTRTRSSASRGSSPCTATRSATRRWTSWRARRDPDHPDPRQLGRRRLRACSSGPASG